MYCSRTQWNFRLIPENGAKSLYVARRKVASRYVYAIAFRSGRGAVATMLSTDPKMHLWIYRAKKPGTYVASEFGHEMIRASIDVATEVLTEAQGGCEWHIIRAGSGLITSTVAYTLAQAVQANAVNSGRPLTNQEMKLLQDIGVSVSAHQDVNSLPE